MKYTKEEKRRIYGVFMRVYDRLVSIQPQIREPVTVSFSGAADSLCEYCGDYTLTVSSRRISGMSGGLRIAFDIDESQRTLYRNSSNCASVWDEAYGLDYVVELLRHWPNVQKRFYNVLAEQNNLDFLQIAEQSLNSAATA